MAYVTEIDIFVYEYDPPHHSGMLEGTHIRGVLCAQRIVYDNECKIKHLAYIQENHAR